MGLRAVHPLDDAAVAAANAALVPHTGGRRLTMGKDDEEYRKMWMEAYRAAGGKVEEIGGSKKKPKKCLPDCPQKKTVSGKIATVTFRSDHNTGGVKLIKKEKDIEIKVAEIDKNGKTIDDGNGGIKTRDFTSKYGDDFDEFMKPEWDVGRGGSADAHPISHTRKLKVEVDIEIDFTVTPEGQVASMEKIVGNASDTKGEAGYLSFDAAKSATFGTERVKITGLINKWELPKYVIWLDETIEWIATCEGEEKPLGSSGTHRAYVTLATPVGKMECPKNNTFEETGDDQIVTEQRLKTAVWAGWGCGETDDRECVDAVFEAMRYDGVGYILEHRWENDPLDNTKVFPKPSLHHYLWLCNTHEAYGECHNIAASFAMYCRIIGVQKSFAVGYMNPQPGLVDMRPFERIPEKSSSGNNMLGKLNKRYLRKHGRLGAHGEPDRWEKVVFFDGADRANNFEGVLVYDGNGLYAIGDDIFDRYSDPHDNASEYFGERGGSRPDPSADYKTAGAFRSQPSNLSKGWCDLGFSMLGAKFVGKKCSQPYAEKSTMKFKWHEDID